MSKVEKCKAMLDYLKTFLVTLLVGLFGMVSYLFLHFDSLSGWQIFFMICGVVLDCVAIGFGFRVALKKMNELGDL